MNFIFHITSRAEWEAAVIAGAHQPAAFAVDGFIHCSTQDQVVATADRIFRGLTDLVLLCIDPERVDADVRSENFDGGRELYPHIYGVLGLDAVVAVLDFPPNADGSFSRPELPPAA